LESQKKEKTAGKSDGYFERKEQRERTLVDEGPLKIGSKCPPKMARKHWRPSSSCIEYQVI